MSTTAWSENTYGYSQFSAVDYWCPDIIVVANQKPPSNCLRLFSLSRPEMKSLLLNSPFVPIQHFPLHLFHTSYLYAHNLESAVTFGFF
jgi:hypothetical protein